MKRFALHVGLWLMSAVATGSLMALLPVSVLSPESAGPPPALWALMGLRWALWPLIWWQWDRLGLSVFPDRLDHHAQLRLQWGGRRNRIMGAVAVFEVALLLSMLH